jgi:nitroreductase
VKHEAIHPPLIAERRSPLAYSDSPVSHEDVRTLHKAARWAPSAYNLQPWRIAVFEKSADGDAFERAFSTLVPFNQSWNANAQVLIAVLADTLTSKGASSPTASYDAGAAGMALLLQAHALALAAHAMSGPNLAALRASFEIAERYAVLSIISVAHHGHAAALSADLAERERARALGCQSTTSWGSDNVSSPFGNRSNAAYRVSCAVIRRKTLRECTSLPWITCFVASRAVF